jgi:hypothetical protein
MMKLLSLAPAALVAVLSLAITGDAAGQSAIDVQVGNNQMLHSFIVNGVPAGELDLSDFEEADIPVRGKHTLFWILGRKHDMFGISAFVHRTASNEICARHLIVQLRDGENIEVTRRGMESDLYGIQFGRHGDLFNEYAASVDQDDIVFGFDPREPRIRPREITAAVTNDIKDHHVTDIQCFPGPPR